MLCVPCVGHTNTHTVLCKGAAYPLLLRPKGNWLLKHSLEALTLEKLGDSAQRSATQILETVVGITKREPGNNKSPTIGSGTERKQTPGPAEEKCRARHISNCGFSKRELLL